MSSNRITEQVWAQANEAYESWDPNDPTSPSIAELLEPFGVSKQAFYAYRRRAGLALKNRWTLNTDQTPAIGPNAFDAVLQALVEARVRILVLETAMKAAGVSIP